jgi:UDP-N-acetylmuramate: L-alanyl-gamma-D-glutamyl-meso-diaminopimelate ligase
MARNSDQQNTKPLHYHLIGIGGTAMASLAGLLKAAGHTVTGSDEKVYPPMSTELQRLGISYNEGYRAENLSPKPDIVVVGNVVSRGNPELEAVLIQKLRYTSAAATIKEEFIWGHFHWRWLGLMARRPRLCCWRVLKPRVLQSQLLIGGGRRISGRRSATDSKYFRDRGGRVRHGVLRQGPKMWHYPPDTAIVTKIEFD